MNSPYLFGRSLLLFGYLLGISGACSSSAADVPSGPPATAAELAKTIDLSTWPVAEGAEAPARRLVASLSYKVKGDDAEKLFEAQKKLLTDKGWKPIEGQTVTPDYASGSFAKSGFLVTLSVMPSGKDGVLSVSLGTHGNIAYEQLPLPAGAKKVYAGPASAIFVVDVPADAAREEVKKLLTAKGWQAYGVQGETVAFKQNNVILRAFVSTPAGKDGKASIQYASEMVSADLPAPADADKLQYAETTTTLSFDTSASPQEVADFYRTALGKLGWEATLDKLTKDGNKEWLIFRHPSKDLLNLDLRPVEGKTRVWLKYQTATELAEMDKRIKEEMEKKAKEQGK